MLWQPPLPSHYSSLDEAGLAAAIEERRARLGRELVILGHHYQQDGVVDHADFTGDSFKLAQLAAERVVRDGARYVVFCGVHFMAESADILTPPQVAVLLPDLSAGCSMADMACLEDAQEAFDQIREQMDQGPGGQRLIPVTYMNSSAAIKAFVGKNGGAVCTSSNARRVLEWAFAGGEDPGPEGGKVKVLFLPDQHLGRNTGEAMGLDVHSQMCLWDPAAPGPLGGNDAQAIRRSDLILWKGHCSVHRLFRPEHVDQARGRDAQVRVIVHPECVREVVQKADLAGSTEKIIQTIQEAPAGTHWAVGTEVHLVARLARNNPDKSVRILSDCQCLCTTMYRIDPQHLLWTLDNLVQGHIVNRIEVDPQTRRWSLEALQRMLRLGQGSGATPATACMD